MHKNSKWNSLSGCASKKRTLKHMIGELVDELLLNKISQSIERLENEDDATDGHGHQQDGVFNYATNFLK